MPVILVTAEGDVATAVKAMRAGALNVVAKPFEDRTMVAAVEDAVATGRSRREQAVRFETVRQRYDALTHREREVLALVTEGLMNKQVAARMQLCEITVKIHRGNVMRKMLAQSLPDLVRMADALGLGPVERAEVAPICMPGTWPPGAPVSSGCTCGAAHALLPGRHAVSQ